MHGLGNMNRYVAMTFRLDIAFKLKLFRITYCFMFIVLTSVKLASVDFVFLTGDTVGSCFL